MDAASLITGGGTTGLLIAIAYAGRLALDAFRAKRADTRDGTTARVTDTATANAVLVKTLESLQKENGRLTERVNDLERHLEKKDAALAALELRVQQLQADISALRREA